MTTSALTSAVCLGLAAGVDRFSFSMIRPSGSTTPPATFVPPTSTPIARRMLVPFRVVFGNIIEAGRARPARARPARARPPRARPARARPGPRRPGRARPARARPGRPLGGVRRTSRPVRAGSRSGTGQDGIEGAESFLDGGGDGVTRTREVRAESGTGLPDPARGPANGAPGTLRRLAG